MYVVGWFLFFLKTKSDCHLSPDYFISANKMTSKLLFPPHMYVQFGTGRLNIVFTHFMGCLHGGGGGQRRPRWLQTYFLLNLSSLDMDWEPGLNFEKPPPGRVVGCKSNVPHCRVFRPSDFAPQLGVVRSLTTSQNKPMGVPLLEKGVPIDRGEHLPLVCVGGRLDTFPSPRHGDLGRR